MDYRMQFVIAKMKNEVHREMSLDELAQSVNLSVSRFHHLFRVETGMSPARYYRMLKIEKARDLLQTTFLSVKQIRAYLNIDERSHFERDFKKIYGLTPAKYRAAAAQFSSSSTLNRE
jgi:transcriptional regulator GlxA family with amidase domain